MNSAAKVSEPENHALANAIAWFGSIKEMVGALEVADALEKSQGLYLSHGHEAARERIHESVLSVEVRSGWYDPAFAARHRNAGSDPEELAPAEYRILLSTGGPALQLGGDLSEHGEPESAHLEYQDWGTPWTTVDAWTLAERTMFDAWKRDHLAAIDSVRATLLAFAQQFYFGE